MALNAEQKALLAALLAVSRGERPEDPWLVELVSRQLATENPVALTEAGEHATSDLIVEDSDFDAGPAIEPGFAVAMYGT